MKIKMTVASALILSAFLGLNSAQAMDEQEKEANFYPLQTMNLSGLQKKQIITRAMAKLEKEKPEEGPQLFCYGAEEYLKRFSTLTEKATSSSLKYDEIPLDFCGGKSHLFLSKYDEIALDFCELASSDACIASDRRVNFDTDYNKKAIFLTKAFYYNTAAALHSDKATRVKWLIEAASFHRDPIASSGLTKFIREQDVSNNVVRPVELVKRMKKALQEKQDQLENEEREESILASLNMATKLLFDNSTKLQISFAKNLGLVGELSDENENDEAKKNNITLTTYYLYNKIINGKAQKLIKAVDTFYKGMRELI